MLSWMELLQLGAEGGVRNTDDLLRGAGDLSSWLYLAGVGFLSC